MAETLTERIAAKIAHLEEQVAAIEANERVIRRIGGFDRFERLGELQFQRNRLAAMKWAATATEGQITARLAQLRSEITADEEACKYGDVTFLAEEAFARIAEIELLELALGTHPVVTGQWPRRMPESVPAELPVHPVRR